MNSENCRKGAIILKSVWILLGLIAVVAGLVIKEDRLLLLLAGNIILGQAVIYSKLLKFEERFPSTDKAKSEISEES